MIFWETQSGYLCNSDKSSLSPCYSLFQCFPTFWSKSSKKLANIDDMKVNIGMKQINSFLANVPILYLLKTSKNQKFSCVFRGYKMGTLAKNGLNDEIQNSLSETMITYKTCYYQLWPSIHFFICMRRNLNTFDSFLWWKRKLSWQLRCNLKC